MMEVHKDQQQMSQEQTNNVHHPIQPQLDYLRQCINQLKSSLQDIKRTHTEPSHSVIMVYRMELDSMQCDMHAMQAEIDEIKSFCTQGTNIGTATQS